LANAAVQASGESIHFVGKEHHLKSLRAIASYYAVGNVSIDGPTSLLTGNANIMKLPMVTRKKWKIMLV
jgi:hypothetical protein